jgi:hypothetical protein
VPARWPAHWTDFVVKPLSGSTANGVNIIRSGVNVWTGQRVRVLRLRKCRNLHTATCLMRRRAQAQRLSASGGFRRLG